MKREYELLGDFLRNKFPDNKFIWDENSKGWYCRDKDFLTKYSSVYIFYDEKFKSTIRSKFYKYLVSTKNTDYTTLRLLILDDFEFVGFTFD